jgi:LmbE family N-acetylglucosaminyl deacetylase
MKILIISPHPDDLEISMGGTAAKLVTEGNEVRSIILTDGHRSSRSFKCTDEEMAMARKREGIKAHKIIGITDFEYYSLPDVEDVKKVKSILTNELNKRFDIIYMPDIEDIHPTHKKVAMMIVKLVEDFGLTPKIFGYEGWNFLHHPLIFVDIEKYIGIKVSAVRTHKSQIIDKPYDEAVEKLARIRAILMDPHKITDTKYSEALKEIA